VCDTGATGHQVEGTGAQGEVAADRIAMADLPVERPGDRLQPDVRVRFDAHPCELRSESVEEAPRSHQRQVALRQRPVHRHRAHPAQRHLARFEQKRLRAVARRGFLLGDRLVGVESGHLS
jgi:hypothetical protein